MEKLPPSIELEIARLNCRMSFQALGNSAANAAAAFERLGDQIEQGKHDVNAHRILTALDE